MSLEQIADNTKTDKNTVNSYLPLYKQQTQAQAQGARGPEKSGVQSACGSSDKVLAQAISAPQAPQVPEIKRRAGVGKRSSLVGAGRDLVWWGQGETYSHGVDAGAGPAVSKAYRYVNDAYHTEHSQQSHHRLRCVD